MSTLEEALELLEFKSIDDVTADSLKMAYRRTLLEYHPDRGGDGSYFDRLIQAYFYLRRVLQRLYGGRDHSSILHPTDIQETRDKQAVNELNNMINQIFDHLESVSLDDFNKKFNALYEEHFNESKDDLDHRIMSERSKGYGDWLRSNESIASTVTLLSTGAYGSATIQPPIIKAEDLNTLFEYTARCGKSAVDESLMLHPEQMAYSVASGGMTLLPSTSGFTSDWESRPEYSDLQAAYTSNNTIIDKIPVFQEKTRSFDDLLKERDVEYKTELDRDLETIAAYEKKKQEEEAEHKRRIQSYFQGTLSSSWALSNRSASSISSLKKTEVCCHNPRWILVEDAETLEEKKEE